MKIIDISLGIGTELLTWPTDPPASVTPTSRLDRGDQANVSEVKLGSHTGTHVDPPVHFIDGTATVDELPLEVLVGPAVVVDLRGRSGMLEPADLESVVPDACARVLLKTDNSAIWRRPRGEFPRDYVSLSPKGAAWLVERGVRLVGTDFLSIEAFDSPGHPTHHTLLETGVVIVEGLDLSAVEAGSYQFVCLPLKVVGGDGAPARAILIQEGER